MTFLNKILLYCRPCVYVYDDCFSHTLHHPIIFILYVARLSIVLLRNHINNMGDIGVQISYVLLLLPLRYRVPL